MGYRPTDRSDVNVVGRFFSHETFNPTGSMNASHALSHNLSLGANGGLSSADKRNSMRLSVNFDKYFDYEVLEKKNDTKNKDNTSSYISARFIDTFIPTAKWELIGGLEYNHEENFATSTLGATPTTKTLDDANVFAQAEYEILKNFDAVAAPAIPTTASSAPPSRPSCRSCTKWPNGASGAASVPHSVRRASRNSITTSTIRACSGSTATPT